METKNMLYLVSEYAPNGEIFGTYSYCLWKIIDICNSSIDKYYIVHGAWFAVLLEKIIKYQFW